jgi:GNAT superfamily N-acetyltransferase
MPKFTKKKAKGPAFSGGFTQSRAAYKQVHAHLSKHLGKHTHFYYSMSEFHQDHTLSLVDEDTKQVLAFCTLNPSLRVVTSKKRKPGAEKYLQICIMEAIDEAQRGKGLGRRMLDELVDIARKGGYECVRTFAIDGAAGFYRKYRFVTDLSMVEHEMNVLFDV